MQHMHHASYKICIMYHVHQKQHILYASSITFMNNLVCNTFLKLVSCRPTDRPTDQPTNRPTLRPIELLSQLKTNGQSTRINSFYPVHFTSLNIFLWQDLLVVKNRRQMNAFKLEGLIHWAISVETVTPQWLRCQSTSLIRSSAKQYTIYTKNRIFLKYFFRQCPSLFS